MEHNSLVLGSATGERHHGRVVDVELGLLDCGQRDRLKDSEVVVVDECVHVEGGVENAHLGFFFYQSRHFTSQQDRSALVQPVQVKGLLAKAFDCLLVRKHV